jgi:NADPH-dependent curcumin reductase CurA
MTAGRPDTTRQWHLVRRPSGTLRAGDLALRDVPLPPLRAGQLLVRNTHLSVDPYMRGRMDDRPSYIPPFELDSPLDGAAVGVVLESRSPELAPGDVVEHFHGLREHTLTMSAEVSRIDPGGLPAEAFLGVLGSPGLSAWIGLTVIAPVAKGDTVLVTGAAGAVGSLAVQIARLKGAGRVVASAGSADKVRHLIDVLGADDAYDYRDGSPRAHLEARLPQGIDVVFDNAGGAQLEAAIDLLRDHARVALCGMASEYDGAEPHSFSNLFTVIRRRATLKGFIVSDHMTELARFRAEVLPWVERGEIAYETTVVEGIERVPLAFRQLFTSGAAVRGKLVVHVDGGLW